MTGASADEWSALPDLLSEAQLVDLAWDKALHRVTLVFACLRRNLDGSELADRSVQLHLFDVQVVAIAHEPSECGVKPSEYRRDRWLTATDLMKWTTPPREVVVAYNSPATEEDVALAHRVEWAMGSERAMSEPPVRLAVCFEHTNLLGLPTTDLTIFFAGDHIEAHSSGMPLELETWQAQNAAWWQNWQHHWSDEPSEDPTPQLEDTILPAGEAPPPDLGYRPPDEPPVDLEPSTLPAGIAATITQWFCSVHAQDWAERARAARDLDRSLDEQAEFLEKMFEESFGRWPYARQIDAWWVEGAVGAVTVRGVEHQMADGEDPAENLETVWTFTVRRRGKQWVIRKYSQGWTAYGSAATRPAEQKPWLARWRAGTIRS